MISNISKHNEAIYSLDCGLLTFELNYFTLSNTKRILSCNLLAMIVISVMGYDIFRYMQYSDRANEKDQWYGYYEQRRGSTNFRFMESGSC